MKESFIVYGEWERHFALLTPSQQGELMMALFAYSNRDQEPDGDPAVKMAFSFIRAAMDENAEKWEKKRATRAESGRSGGLARASNFKQSQAKGSKAGKSKQSQAKQAVSESVSVSGSPKETEPPLPPQEEPKVQWAEHVTMTNSQQAKLLAAHGPADTARLIEILDNYKGSTGKKYKDDYRAILSWCVDRLQEDKEKQAGEGRTEYGGIDQAGNSGGSAGATRKWNTKSALDAYLKPAGDGTGAGDAHQPDAGGVTGL